MSDFKDRLKSTKDIGESGLGIASIDTYDMDLMYELQKIAPGRIIELSNEHRTDYIIRITDVPTSFSKEQLSDLLEQEGVEVTLKKRGD